MNVRVKRCFLIGMLVTAGLGALLAVGIVAIGGASSYRAMDTALSIGFIVGFGLSFTYAAYTALDRPGWRVVAGVGIVLAGVTMLTLMAVAICENFIRSSFGINLNVYDFDEWLVTLSITSALFCLISCVGALRMKAPGSTLQLGTIVAMGCLYLLLLAAIWERTYDPDLASFDMVLGILTGTGLFAVFLTYRFFGLKVPDPLSAIDQKIFLRCPRCLKEQDVPVGESHCMACRLRITVDIEEPKCPKCGYNLRALTRPICPECGASIVPEEVDPQAALLKWAQANDEEAGRS